MNVGTSVQRSVCFLVSWFVQFFKSGFACVGSVYGLLEAKFVLVEAREFTALEKVLVIVVFQFFLAFSRDFSLSLTGLGVVITISNCVPIKLLLAVTVFADLIAGLENVARSSLVFSRAFIVSRNLSFNALGFMCFTLFR